MRALANLQAAGRVSAIDASSTPGRVFVLGEEKAVLALRDLPGVVALTQADEAQPADDPTAPEDAQLPRLPDAPTIRLPDYRLSFCRLVEFSIDGRHLLYPAVALEVIQFEHIVRRPVKMIRQVGYLFVEFI